MLYRELALVPRPLESLLTLQYALKNSSEAAVQMLLGVCCVEEAGCIPCLLLPYDASCGTLPAGLAI